MIDRNSKHDCRDPNIHVESIRLDYDGLMRLAESIGKHLGPGDVLLLFGPMGVGKTTFVRALAKGMGVYRSQHVCSPTYTICLVHDGDVPLTHVDFFRLGESASIENENQTSSYAAFEALGLDADELCDSDRVLVTEWSEYWCNPPSPRIEIHFYMEASQPEIRWLELRGFGTRGIELARRWQMWNEFV